MGRSRCGEESCLSSGVNDSWHPDEPACVLYEYSFGMLWGQTFVIELRDRKVSDSLASFGYLNDPAFVVLN